MSDEDEVVMYLVARTDLAMSPGKFGAQCGHGTQLAIRAAEQREDLLEFLKEWESKVYPKIVLGVKGEAGLLGLEKKLTESGIVCRVVKDLGRTELAPNTYTLLSTVPMRKSVLAKTALKRLQLYK